LSSSQVRDRGRKRIHLRDAARSLVAAWSCLLNGQGCRLDEDVLDDWLWAMDIKLGGQAKPATGE
jgi:hypothetical protein